MFYYIDIFLINLVTYYMHFVLSLRQFKSSCYIHLKSNHVLYTYLCQLISPCLINIALRWASNFSTAASVATAGPILSRPSLDTHCAVMCFWNDAVDTPLYMRAQPQVGRVWFVPLAQSPQLSEEYGPRKTDPAFCISFKQSSAFYRGYQTADC